VIATAPAVTEKLSDENDATPFVVVVAFTPAIVTAALSPELPVMLRPVPAVTSRDAR
jgi:hypothetical protein